MLSLRDQRNGIPAASAKTISSCECGAAIVWKLMYATNDASFSSNQERQPLASELDARRGYNGSEGENPTLRNLQNLVYKSLLRGVQLSSL